MKMEIVDLVNKILSEMMMSGGRREGDVRGGDLVVNGEEEEGEGERGGGLWSGRGRD